MKRKSFLLFLAIVFPLSVFASHPQPGDMPQVKLKAHQLENSASLALSTAQALSWNSRHERYALEHLDELAQAARHFHQQVEQYFGDPEHTERDFEHLLAAYHDANSTNRYLRAYNYSDFRYQWDNVTNLLHEIEYYYGGHNPVEPHPSPIQAIVNVEQGGSWSDRTVKLRGYLNGLGLETAGVYVDGALRVTLNVNPNLSQNAFYVRLKLHRSAGTRLFEIRVRQGHHGLDQVVWSQYL